MKGTITTIQRMSIHDGPGIRSTLFLKGCNLHCAWCHNPETWSIRPQLQYISSKCICCGSCVHVCGNRALQIGDKLIIDRNACSKCGLCVNACVTGALTWIGKQVESSEIVHELLQDRVYFEKSGGGVTLSGGEPLLQPDFAEDILRYCCQEGVHTAVETNLTEPWPIVERFLPLVKLWMCDLKVADSDIHRKWTGLGNAQIIANLHRLSECGIPIIVRTPVIPGVNDSQEAIEDICKIVSELKGNVAYELLGFHTLGFGKFTDLGIENKMAGIAPLDRSVLKNLQQIPEHYGLKRVL